MGIIAVLFTIAGCIYALRIVESSYFTWGKWFKGVGIVLATTMIAGFALNASAARMEVVENTLYIQGELTKGDPSKLQGYLNHYPNLQWVGLESGGGIASVGWELAHMIRNAELKTFVWSTCASACGYAYMGGKERLLRDGGKIGFHPAYYPNQDMVKESPNNLLDRGQTLAMDTAYQFLAFVPAGDEWEAIKFLREMYKTTHWSSMNYPNVFKLQEAGIVTGTYN